MGALAKLGSAPRALACLVVLLLAFARPASAAQAQPDDAAFSAGVAAYRDGDWESARREFKTSLEFASSERASVLRNLGNVAFRQAKPLEAAGWFTAATQEAPRDADAWFNLEFARREAGLPPADRGDLRDTAVRLATMLRLEEAERLLLTILGLLAATLVWEALRGGVAAKSAAWALAVLAAVALIPYGAQLARADRDACFVVQPEGAALNSEPRDGAALIGRLAPAGIVERIDQLPGWVRVRSAADELGWVREESVLALRSFGPNDSKPQGAR